VVSRFPCGVRDRIIESLRKREVRFYYSVPDTGHYQICPLKMSMLLFLCVMFLKKRHKCFELGQMEIPNPPCPIKDKGSTTRQSALFPRDLRWNRHLCLQLFIKTDIKLPPLTHAVDNLASDVSPRLAENGGKSSDKLLCILALRS
jgi:hypothetical protein